MLNIHCVHSLRNLKYVHWMIGRKNLVVGFRSSYMQFLPNIDMFLCLPKFGCLAPMYCSTGHKLHREEICMDGVNRRTI